MSKNKHLTCDERLQIEHQLNQGSSIKKIARIIGKCSSTVSREICKHAISSNKSAPYRIPNRCIHRFDCSKSYLCQDKPNCVKLCKTCRFCNGICPDFKEEICQKLSLPPYVCNGCKNEATCTLRKLYYRHRKAHEAYRMSLTATREGVNISEGELLALDSFISPLLLKGQSVHHIVINNPNEFNISEKSIYRYVSGGLLKAKNIDLPRVCKLRPRKCKPVEHKVDKSCRIDRSYDDFKSFLSQHDGLSVVEMDSVIGRIGGKVLLTLLFKSCDLMLAFIRDRNTSQSVIDIFNWLYDLLGHQAFISILSLVLTDNGSEFSNPKALEFDSSGNYRTRIFYCDPGACYQKPNVELNHEFIRKILPKGSSFDDLTQADINLIMSHINSYSRPKLNDKTPYELFAFLYGQDILDKLGLSLIPPNEIVLKPSLFRK